MTSGNAANITTMKSIHRKARKDGKARKIPKGWRELGRDEVIRKGDRFFNTVESIGPLGWTESLSIGHRVSANLMGATYIRPAIGALSTPGEE